jgi:hypothetical protein
METSEVKLDKRTKEYKALNSNPTLEKIESLIESGIPLKKVVFHDTVLSFGAQPSGEPESALYDGGTMKKSRLAQMWLTSAGIVIKQKDNYKIIPAAAVKDNDVKL